MSISMHLKEFKCALPLWAQTQAAIDGKAAIIKLHTCLVDPLYRVDPKKPTVAAQRLKAYWQRAKYFNATGRTLESNDGMIWSKRPEMELPPELDYMKDDATGSGDSLRVVAQKITKALSGIGRYGALADIPNVESATQSEQQGGAASPRIITYKPEQIFYWRVDNGLKEVRLFETYEVQKDEFNFVCMEQVRRLVMIDGVYRNQLYQEGEKVEDVAVTMNGSKMDRIPFQFFGADENSANIGFIPMFDLGSQNLGHFMLDADNRDNLHYHGQGMTNVYVENADDLEANNPNGLDVGAKGRNIFGKDDRVEILQIESTGAIPSEMLRDEQRMVMLGAQLVQNTSSTQTLGAKEIEANATTSIQKRITENASEGIEQLLKWCAMFIGVNPDSVEFKLNTEFMTDDMSPEMLAQHIAAVQSGYLPQTGLFESARRAGLTKDDDEKLLADIGEQSMGIQGTSEEMARLMAENESLKEQLANG